MGGCRPLTYLLAALALALVLAACGTSRTVDPPGDPVIHEFRATGLDKGEGEWQISWRASAGTVTLNGQGVRNSGTIEHEFAQSGPGPAEYTLVARNGERQVERSLTVAPISGIMLTDEAGRTGPFQLDLGETLQLRAIVQSADSVNAEPSQLINWSSTDENVLRVDGNGLVEAVGLTGPDQPVRVVAESRQYTGMYRWLEFEVVDLPEIIEFTAIPVEDGNGAWDLCWVTDAETVTLDGSPVAARGSRTVTPRSLTTYELTAANGAQTTRQGLSLAPPSSIRVGLSGNIEVGQGDSLQLEVGQGDSLQLEVEVAASGSDVRPSQAVRFSSSDETVASVSESGLLTGVAPGTARLTVTSEQDADLSHSFEVEVLGPGLYNFVSEDAPEQLEAGTLITLSWLATALSDLTLTELPSGRNWSISHDGRRGMELEVPSDEATLNYRLDWVTTDGRSGSSVLWSEARPVLGWVCSVPDQLVTFPDPVLEAEVRRVFNRPTGSLRCGDVQRELPSMLNEYGQEMSNAILLNRCGSDLPGVGSLEGIQHLTELVRLELECNNISDIRRLSGLHNLVEINFDNNDISDVTPLRELVNVRVLGLYNNRLTDISGLEGLRNLEILYLSENRVKDVSPLAGLTNLEHAWLYLNCDNITYNDDSPDRYVTSWSGCLRDLSPLSGLTSLVSLVFHQNEIDDISFINGNMSELALVLATGNQIADVSALANLRSLTTVAVDDNYLTDLSAFSGNPDFPADGLYSWTRGTVSMPPAGSFPAHLMMGYNCFDPTQPALQPQIQTLRGRGASVEGEAAAVKDCAAGTSQRTAPAAILKMLDSLRHAR